MTRGNKLGWAGVATLTVYILVGVIDADMRFARIEAALMILAFVLPIAAGIAGPRWWFAMPVALILFVLGIWLFVVGH